MQNNVGNAPLAHGLFTMKTPLRPTFLVARVVHLEVATKYRVVKAFRAQKMVSPTPYINWEGYTNSLIEPNWSAIRSKRNCSKLV